MSTVGIAEIDKIKNRIKICDYLTVAQLYLQDNFLLERELTPDDIKPRLLGHWGTCHGINVAYANLKSHYQNEDDFSFILGPGHGFPALQANLFIDGELMKIDKEATLDEADFNTDPYTAARRNSRKTAVDQDSSKETTRSEAPAPTMPFDDEQPEEQPAKPAPRSVPKRDVDEGECPNGYEFGTDCEKMPLCSRCPEAIWSKCDKCKRLMARKK